MPADASFCPKCGRSIDAGPIPDTDPYAMKRTIKDSYRSDRRAFHEARRAARWGARMETPEWALINAVFGGLTVILIGGLLYLAASGLTPLVTWSNFWAYFLLGLGTMLFLRGLLAIFLVPSWHERGSLIAGIIVATIGAAGIAVTTYGLGQYFWIGVIVIGGILVIVAGILSYLFRVARP
jgi:hypothetical protein